MFRNLSLIFILMAGLISCGGNNTSGNSNENKELTATEVQQIVKEAYIHCFPIFENYKGLYFYGILKQSPKYMPMNTIRNETKLYTPDDKLVVSPNNDTYYSTGILDLRAEPVIVKVPESKNRFYVLQLVDMVTNNFAYIGVNATGTQAGTYAITGPSFTGKLPDAVMEIKSLSQFLIFAGRTAVNAENPQDIAEARKLQDQYQVGPISKFYPGFAVQKVDSINFPGIKETDHSTEEYFNRVNFLLNYTKLNADDQSIIDKFKVIGIEAGKPYEFVKTHPEYKDAILNGIKEGMSVVDSLGDNIGKKTNGWSLAPLAKEYFGTDYNLRTGYAKKAIYANTPSEAYYPTAAVDAEGQTLDGNNNYTITFPAGKLPPAKYFWSITMYDNAHQLLVANELKRYSIGDRTKSLKPNPDGSLTIYVGNKMPAIGTDNWLPAPPSGFNLMMRIYGPKEEVLSGIWTPPAVMKSR